MIITRKPQFQFLPSYLRGLKLWLDSSNVLNGSNPANGALVSTVNDLSGVTGNATAAGGLRPTFTTNVQNGLPALFFNGGQSLNVANLAVGSNLTMFVVAKPSTNSFFTEQSPDINSNDGFYMYGNGQPCQIKNGGSSVMNTNSPGWMGTATGLFMMTYNGSNVSVWKNGAVYDTDAGTISNNLVTNTLFIGSRNNASLFYTGYLMEMIIYNAALSAGQIALNNNYFRTKWAIY